MRDLNIQYKDILICIISYIYSKYTWDLYMRLDIEITKLWKMKLEKRICKIYFVNINSSNFLINLTTNIIKFDI